MTDPSLLAALRIPSPVLIALDNRTYHFALQPWHYLVRIAHVLSMAAFFGGIALLDLRLMGVRAAVTLRDFAEQILPWLYVSFGVAVVTGVALFLYDPVNVGSHVFFVPKLILVALGLANALLFHRTGYVAALAAEARMPARARIAGGVSLALWTGAVVCACLTVEAAPRVLLR